MNFMGALLGFIGGAGAAFLASRLMMGKTHHDKGQVMSNAIEHKLSMGPKIVAVGGGTGLSTLLSGLKSYTRNITAVVTVTDEGGSSGRLRQEWGVLPPGDVRNCLVALAENDNSLQRILSFRFKKGELAGHSLGNLILLAATELTGDFQKAVEELNTLLAIRGRVLPVTTESVVLTGETTDGRKVRGELEVSDYGAQLARLWLEPRNAEPLKGVIDAINEAELIVLGPGSLFTSILPNLLIEKVAIAVRAARAPKVYVANLMTQPGETEGMSLINHVDWISGVLGGVPDMLVTNCTPIPQDVLERYHTQGAEPLYLTREESDYLQDNGCKVIEANLVDYTYIGGGKLLRHNTRNLAEMLIHHRVRGSA